MNTPGTGVPRLLHMIWFGPDPLPARYETRASLWRTAYPDWEFRLWDEQTYLAEIPPYNVELFRSAHLIQPEDAHRLRADIARLSILYALGGLYVDTDTEPHDDMTRLVDQAGFTAGRSPKHVNGTHPITNAVMASHPGHVFLKHAVDELDRSVQRYKGRSTAQMAGPWHLERTYERHYREVHPHMQILKPGELYDGTYLVHHWDNKKRRKGLL